MDTRIGTIGSTNIQLASWLEPNERYARRYVPLDTEGAEIPEVASWRIRSWKGGEGEDVWTEELSAFREADGLRPLRVGDGLDLARLSETTKDSGGVSDLADAQRFGLGQGKLWTAKSDNGYSWDTSLERWAAGIATGATSSDVTSLTDGDDTFMYSGHEDKIIRRWKSGSSASWYSSFTENPVIRSFGGVLYALDGDDLYEVDKGTVDTRVIKADLSGKSSDYLAATPWCYNRMSLSDKGPIWIQRLDNGQTFIWEYNVASDRQERVGKLPVDFVFPYSIYFTNGYMFVGFRYANAHAEDGKAYVYFQRGAQRGVAGPFRATGSAASKPVLIAGLVGDDLVLTFDEKVWAYNLTAGGVAVIGDQQATTDAEDAITFGKEVFTAGMGDKVERFKDDEYEASGSLNTGRFDFGFPGIRKQLLDVGVITDPLPANTSVSMEVLVDGGSAVSLTGTHDTDSQRRFVWTAPTGTTLIGYEFELKPSGATTAAASTPTIRELFANATGAEHRIEWVLAIDCSALSHSEIDALNALPGGGNVVFTDPWQNRESDAADTFNVTVKEVFTPEVRESSTPTEVVGRVRLLSTDIVSGTGGS